MSTTTALAAPMNDKARARLLKEMTEARLIETAPRDGSRILGKDRHGWREMWWKVDSYEGEFWQDEFDSEPEPTHWAPLPT